jgi:hypothetical protein
VARSEGKNASTRTSCAVTSTGVPIVETTEKTCRPNTTRPLKREGTSAKACPPVVGRDTLVASPEQLVADARGGPMKFVYVVTTGTDDPTKASLPLHLAANGSLEVGHETSVLLAGDATEMLLGDNLEQMQGIGVPPARDLLTKLRDHSVPVYV